MRKSKRARLKATGWVVGTVKEFLGLSDAEAVLIEMKLALSLGHVHVSPVPLVSRTR
jgi:hypothetical protein